MFRVLFLQFRNWKRKPLVWLGFLLGLSFQLSFTMDIVRAAEDTGEWINVLEPTIISGSSAWNMLFLLLGVFLILSDSPFLNDYTPAVVMRISRKKWFLIQILYIAVVCILYFLCLSLFSAMLCISFGYIDNVWSHLLYAIASGNDAYQKYGIEFAGLLFMKLHTPVSAYAMTLLSQCAYAITLELIIFSLNVYLRKGYGICAAVSIHVLGYVIFLEGLVGVKKISLLIHALPAMHANQFYTELSASPTCWESVLVFIGVIVFLIGCLMKISRRFDFIKKG